MRLPRLSVTRAGRALAVLAVPAWAVGLAWHWEELLAIAATATVLLVGALLLVLVPRPAVARVEARPWRTAVGALTRVELGVRPLLLPMVAPRVRLEGEVLPQELRLRTLWPGRETTESFEDPALRRGVFEVGPLVHLRSDPLGLVRRETSWGRSRELWVRPRVLVPSTFLEGSVFDLEGLPSDQLSTSDLAFHALREYVPGDDLRSVHWRSSAKADSLLVRQYVESRTLHCALVIDDDPASYADPEEFELAVSAAASLGLRGLVDGFELDLVCGDRRSEPLGRESLLDECCHVALAPPGEAAGLASRAHLLARGRPLVGLAVVVTGSTCDDERLFEALETFGHNRQRVAVRAELGAAPSPAIVHGVRTVTIGELTHLSALTVLAAR